MSRGPDIAWENWNALIIERFDAGDNLKQMLHVLTERGFPGRVSSLNNHTLKRLGISFRERNRKLFGGDASHTNKDRLRFWTRERYEELTALREAGHTWPVIAAILSERWHHPLSTASIHGANHKYQVSQGKRKPSVPKPENVREPKSEYFVRRECRRPPVDRASMSLTARLMGDPPPGRTPWAIGA